MHPLELMRKHEWSYAKLAVEFRVSEAAVKSWGFRKKAKAYRNPPAMAFRLADFIDKQLSKE